jgi:hypothetical protein
VPVEGSAAVNGFDVALVPIMDQERGQEETAFSQRVVLAEFREADVVTELLADAGPRIEEYRRRHDVLMHCGGVSFLAGP